MEREVKISSATVVQRDRSGTENSVCSLCCAQFARYTCPRCNVQYCSLNCYKSEKHAQCAEGFYRDSFVSELHTRTTSCEERQRMMDILKRMEEENSREDPEQAVEGEEETLSLEERMGGLNLDKDIDQVWEKMTDSEKQQFHKAVTSGHLGSLLSVHIPWWDCLKPVTPVKESAAPSSDKSSNVPQVLSALPPLRTLVQEGKISRLIRYNSLNVIYGYAYMVRMYNGAHHDLPIEASQTVMDISGTLSQNASYSTSREAIAHAVTTVQQNAQLFKSNEWTFSVIKDVGHILSSLSTKQCLVPNALSDLYNLLSSAKSQLKIERTAEESQKQYRNLLLARKKVYFLTVWASENLEELKLIANLVDIEYSTSVASWKQHFAGSTQEQLSFPQLEAHSAKLIEEVETQN